jgi:UrcA family protein
MKHTSIKLLRPLVAATIVSLSSLASLAAASEKIEIRSGVPSVVVKYDAASLVTRAGVKDLHSRLAIAAQSVCTALDTRLLGLREEYDQCVRNAVRRGVDDVGNQNLTNFHRHRALPRVLAAN